MTQQDVFEQFKKIFPQYTDRTEAWFPNGKHSIRIRLLTGHDFIFTYNNHEQWSFETVDMFLKRLT